MPLLAAQDTSEVLNGDPLFCENRSLLLDRFAHSPPTESAEKKRWMDFLCLALEKKAQPFKLIAWREFLLHCLDVQPEHLLFGQLQGRLVLNRFPGPPATNSLCLDRLSGIPYIPGSAIKGCARRMAIQLLHDCPELADKLGRLIEIARVFGWHESDWRVRPSGSTDLEPAGQRSDLAWACGPIAWPELSQQVQRALFDSSAASHKREVRGRPSPGDSAGAIAFLPSYPLPSSLWPYPQPDLELEVRSSHHPHYYRGLGRLVVRLPARGRDGHLREATDTEDPQLYVFPTIAPGHLFVFVLPPVRGYFAGLLTVARRWLQAGLETFGLGAQTTAGYGWFDCSETLQDRFRALWLDLGAAEKRRLLQEREAEERQAREAEAQQAALSLRQALETMSPEELEDHKLAQLSDDQFRSKLQYFSRDLAADEQAAVVRALRAGRARFWEDLKQRAKKGGHWAQVEQAIRAVSKKSGLGKMP